MGRLRLHKEPRAQRAQSLRMELAPLVDKEVLGRRLQDHLRLMSNVIEKGLDYRSIPRHVFATIVRDFQTAGMAVPTEALRAVGPLTHRQPAPPYRPAPIALPPLPQTSRGPAANLAAQEAAYQSLSRDQLLRRGFNPKIGGPNVTGAAAAMPYAGASRGLSLPYLPVNRYTVGATPTGAKVLAESNWLPPWMLYGDQPNQFVKSTSQRPMSMGKGPQGPALPMPSAAVQVMNARKRAGVDAPLPYLGRPSKMPFGVREFSGPAAQAQALATKIPQYGLPPYQGGPPPAPPVLPVVVVKRKADKPLPPPPKKAAAKAKPQPLPPLPPKKAAAVIAAVAKDPSTRLSISSPPASPPSPAAVIPIATPVKKAAAKKAAASAGPAAAAGQRASRAPVKFTPSKSPVPSAQDVAAAVKDSPLFKARRRKLNMDDDKSKP